MCVRACVRAYMYMCVCVCVSVYGVWCVVVRACVKWVSFLEDGEQKLQYAVQAWKQNSWAWHIFLKCSSNNPTIDESRQIHPKTREGLKYGILALIFDLSAATEILSRVAVKG